MEQGGIAGRRQGVRAFSSPYVLLSLAILFWAGNFVLGRAMHADIPPIAFNFLRWFTAGAILTPFAIGSLLDHRAVLRRHWRIMSVLAALGIAGFNSLSYSALGMTSNFNAAVMMSAVPVTIPIVDFLVNRERIRPVQALGIAVSLMGVLTILFQGDLERARAFRFGEGEVWMVVAVLVWAGYSVALRRRPEGLPPLAFLLALTWGGVLILSPVYAAEFVAKGGVSLTWQSAVTILYVGAFASVGSYIFWNKGVAEVGPTRAGLFSHLMPVFSAGLAYVFLGEALAPYHAAGLGLILAGLLLTARAGRA